MTVKTDSTKLHTESTIESYIDSVFADRSDILGTFVIGEAKPQNIQAGRPSDNLWGTLGGSS